jgi:hypothetical protein
MADFKLRAPPRLRLSALVSIGGVIGQGAAVPLTGSALASAQAAAALLRGVNLGGAASASAQATAALLRGLRLQGAAVAGASASASFNWFVPEITLTIGAGAFPGGQSNVAATLPGNFIPGGLFLIDPDATPLHAGMTFSESGVLNVGSATISTATGVRFIYHEPNALATLTLHPNATGTLPYLATWYPPETVVPAGLTAVSPDDANLRGSVLSTWPDGSAQVITLAGETAVTSGVTKTVRLRAGAPSGTALTTARINAIVSTIAVNFGGGVQTLTLSGATPDRTWWANESTICARYRLSCNVDVLEAVVDIHAFRAGTNDSALVEVVIENGKFNANAASQAAPASQTYTNATVSVNGTTIATVSSSGGPQGSHRGFSAWYCSAKVVGGTVTALTTAQQQAETFGIEVTHDTASMQAHPLFYRYDKAAPYNFLTQAIPPGDGRVSWPSQAYSADAYVPWITGRHRGTNMGGGSDSPSIGPFTQWDSRYLQAGDRYVRRAVLCNALAVLTFNINYRHNGTGSSANLVPTGDQSSGRFFGDNTWPSAGTASDTAAWEVAHHPATGLVSFMCRPSPCFIELAQKVALWNGAWSTPIGDASGTPDGTFGAWYQVRGKGWCMRSLAHAIFLSPDGDPWKAPGKSALTRNVTGLLLFRDSPLNKLDFMWEGTPTSVWDDTVGNSGHQASNLMHNYFALGCHAAARARVLSGSAQINADALADWSCKYPVRWVNEAPGGAWRYNPIRWSIAPVGAVNLFEHNASFDEFADYPALAAGNYTGTTPALAGSWMSGEGTLTAYSQFVQDVSGGAYYPSYFWSNLTLAVERDISGASAAWDKVQANITTLATWRNGFAGEPRWGFAPRNA